MEVHVCVLRQCVSQGAFLILTLLKVTVCVCCDSHSDDIAMGSLSDAVAFMVM